MFDCTGAGLIDAERLLQRLGVRPGLQVADFGCGALGHFVFPAARLVGGEGRVYAVDVQSSVVETMRKRAKFMQAWNIHPVWSDVERVGATRIPEHSLDLIIMAHLLSSVRAQAEVLQEAWRLMKPAGHVLILEWKPEPTVLGPDVRQRLSSEHVQDLLQSGAWKTVDVFHPSDHHHACIGRCLKVPVSVVETTWHGVDTR